MIALILILAAFYLIAEGVSRKRLGDRVIEEILAAEQRQIERDRQAGLALGQAVGWHGPGVRR